MALEPKIILTLTNERIIAGVGEYTDENNNNVCLVLKSPYIVNLVPHGDESTQQYKVSFTKWIPYSASNMFRIPYSYVVTIGEVEADILNLYKENFGDQLDDTDTLPAIDPDIMPEE